MRNRRRLASLLGKAPSPLAAMAVAMSCLVVAVSVRSAQDLRRVDVVPAQAVVEDAASPATAPLQPPRPPASLEQSLARPLFEPGRRPPAHAAAVITDVAPGPPPDPAPAVLEPDPIEFVVAAPDVAMIGSASRDGTVLILFRYAEGGTEVWRRVGESIGSWAIVSATVSEAHLRQGETDLVLGIQK